jgi:hypothetical protein
VSKHTPGPWNRVANSIHSKKCGCIVLRLPAYTDSYGDEPPEQIARWDADAYLIAAAPELLSELEYRYAQNLCFCGHPACRRCEDDRQTLAVINKARGETK